MNYQERLNNVDKEIKIAEDKLVSEEIILGLSELMVKLQPVFIALCFVCTFLISNLLTKSTNFLVAFGLGSLECIPSFLTFSFLRNKYEKAVNDRNAQLKDLETLKKNLAVRVEQSKTKTEVPFKKVSFPSESLNQSLSLKLK